MSLLQALLSPQAEEFKSAWSEFFFNLQLVRQLLVEVKDQDIANQLLTTGTELV